MSPNCSYGSLLYQHHLDQVMTSHKLLKPYFIENRYRILVGLLSLIIVDLLQLIIPRIIKWAVDDLTTNGISNVDLLKYALYMVVLATLIGLFRYAWRRCLLGTSRRVEEGLRNQLFNHLQTLSTAYFRKTSSGDLMAHATNDIQQIRMATGMGLVALNDAVVLGTAAICFMAYINVTLTLFVLIPMPFIVLGTRFFSKKMYRRYQQVQAAFSDMTELVRERFAGIRIIKAYAGEEQSSNQMRASSRHYVTENLRLVRVAGFFMPMMLLFTNICLAIVLFLGGRLTIYNTITPGDFVAFISYLGLITWPMMAMGWVTNLLQRGAASLDRIDRILQTPPEIASPPNALKPKHVHGEIRFQNVEFRYQSDGPIILSDISFKLKPGQIMGIVGPPGSGKTTLINLIPRLYDPSRGNVLLDGHDIRQFDLKTLRHQIAFLSQEPFLFAGTIRENIILKTGQPNDQLLTTAIDKAALAATLTLFPKGLDTIVGEKGIILSGGQKQRIAIARALLSNAPILVLDDPISQVDVETGQKIIAAIRQIRRFKTIIIVSHRISAVSFADQILSLDSGRVIEAGTHADLIDNNLYYAHTYQLQQIEEDTHAA